MYGCKRVFGASQQQVKVTTERLKVLKVIGEKVGQIVVENSVPINAIKIDKINAEIRETVDHIFKNKIVKQGIIHKQVFYVDPDNVVRHLAEDIPFMLTVDIPGVDPDNGFLEVQNHLLDIDTDYILTPAAHSEPGVLTQKVVAHVLVKVSEWTQLDVVTNVDIFPKINSLNMIVCKAKRNTIS
ncbi:MAG TPA: DUF3794 domain-containing protein [Bacillota bacterium]|nr:DUF3794 domain-containing protein [Bacillota bacterium]HOL10193.1 DUF3794 domain-containing protein [Bacillota bacterium]HPO97945.1 DUF3794 domain-containing protein [Bacillota bacterium]